MDLALAYASAYAQSPTVWSDVLTFTACFMYLRAARRRW
ncbi:MAG: hypothetical protein BWX64_01354 [Acidobacteria bacterium ADurb.Bin051]|nr:MAG: hypothetical protein BWX64_01354 [Acidobacteria bacterium ADurb.Bin051]